MEHTSTACTCANGIACRYSRYLLAIRRIATVEARLAAAQDLRELIQRHVMYVMGLCLTDPAYFRYVAGEQYAREGGGER